MKCENWMWCVGTLQNKVSKHKYGTYISTLNNTNAVTKHEFMESELGAEFWLDTLKYLTDVVGTAITSWIPSIPDWGKFLTKFILCCVTSDLSDNLTEMCQTDLS